jgi:hypothetical protein
MKIINTLFVASTVLLVSLSGCNPSDNTTTAWETNSASGGMMGSSTNGSAYGRSTSHTANQSTAQSSAYSDVLSERDKYRTVHEYHFGGGYYY